MEVFGVKIGKSCFVMQLEAIVLMQENDPAEWDNHGNSDCANFRFNWGAHQQKNVVNGNGRNMAGKSSHFFCALKLETHRTKPGLLQQATFDYQRGTLHF